MNFRDIEGLVSDDLNAENRHLRRSIYIEFANTTCLPKLYSDIVRKFTTYIAENFLPCSYKGDILYALFKKDKIIPTLKLVIKPELKIHVCSNPLLPAVQIADELKCSKQITTKMQEIGYQHLTILSDISDTSDTSESSDSYSTSTCYSSDSDFESEDTIPLRIQLKMCQKAIHVDCEPMLKYHYSNMTKMSGTTVHVNVLIFLSKSACKKLAEYLGVIYIEDILRETQEHDMDTVLFKLNNNNSKLYQLIQSYINKKLIAGCHNICLTHTLQLWNTINANAKAVISDKDNRLLYLKPKRKANYYIELNKDPPFIKYIEGLSLIIDQVLSCDCHVVAKYKCEDSYYNLKLSLIAIIPFYILQYFTQCAIKHQKHKLKLI